MSSFTDPLVVIVLPENLRGLGLFALYLPFSYDIGFEGSGETIVVPAGFRTDFASIPWFARAFIPIGGRTAKPAMLHDWLLAQGDPRAHAIFAEALGVAGVSPLLRWVLVTAVTGWSRLKRAVTGEAK